MRRSAVAMKLSIGGFPRRSRRILERFISSRVPAWFPVIAFARFCTVALVIGVPGAGMLYLLVEEAGIHYLAAGAINCVGMTVLSYVLNSIYTFGYFVDTRGFARFLTSRLGSIIVGTALYVLLTIVFGVWYLAASLLSAATANLLTFTLSHLWVWTHRPRRLQLRATSAGAES